MSNITVTTETLQEKSQFELIVNRQRRHTAIATNGATAQEVLQAAVEAYDDTLGVVRKNADGSLTLNGQLYIFRNGTALEPTSDLDTVILPEDRVVVERRHQNA